MATRAGIIFKKNGKELVKIYNHWDGYPDGLGKDIYMFLKDMKIVNGIPYGVDTSNMANGFGCLVAQFISRFKTNIGGLYIYENDFDFNNSDVEFVYIIECTKLDNLNIICYDTYYKRELYSGGVENFIDFINNYGEDDE